MEFNIIHNENEKLLVKPINIARNNNNPKLNEMIPQHPALLYIPSVRGSGKTNLLVHMLTESIPFGYKKFFHQIYIFSGSLSQPIWQKITIPEENKFDTYSNEHFQELVDKLKSDEDYGKRTLIIIDDMTGDDIYKNKSSLYKFSFNHRHFPQNASTSIWLVSHSYKSLPKAMRNNITDLIIYKIHSQVEKYELWEDNGGGLKKIDFFKLLDMITNKKFNFLYIKKDEPIKTRFRNNFNTIIELINL